MGAVSQPLQAAISVAAQPRVHALAGHPVALGDHRHRQPVTHDLYHRVIALLDHAALPQHPSRPPTRR
jgi:hypothetical protein